MHSQIWVVSTLLISIVLIVLTIVKFKFHPFLALLLNEFPNSPYTERCCWPASSWER